MQQMDVKKITRNSRVRRSPEDLLRDMVIIVNHQGLSYGTKFFALHNAIWMWTERFGKYEGCRDPSRPGCEYWSSNALEQVATLSDRGKLSTLMRHEHVVPRIVLIDRILGSEQAPSGPWSFDDLEALFDRYCIGVVITKEEDDKQLAPNHPKSMPNEWQWEAAHCPWARYKSVGIEVRQAQVTWSRTRFIVQPGALVEYAALPGSGIHRAGMSRARPDDQLPRL